MCVPQQGEQLPDVAGGENVQLPMKPGRFMPGLVEGLVGVKKGEVCIGNAGHGYLAATPLSS